MNEQIQEIAEQQGLTGPNFLVSSQELQKFAELIVKKCIKAAGEPADGLILDNTWHDGVRASVWSIQQEFGFDRSFGVE